MQTETHTADLTQANQLGQPALQGPRSFPLSLLGLGKKATVVAVGATPNDAVRLKSLGLCEGRPVELVRQGDPLIVRVVGSRIGVASHLAAAIQVLAG